MQHKRMQLNQWHYATNEHWDDDLQSGDGNEPIRFAAQAGSEMCCIAADGH